MSMPHRFKQLFSETKRRRRANSIRPRGLSMESLETRSLLSSVPFDTTAAYPTEDTDGFVESALISTSEDRTDVSDSPSPVLMVISNQDFWYQDYADTRSALEQGGLEVVVAATTTDVAQPQHASGQGADGGYVRPDLALADVNAEDYSAIVFVGGWGMAQYQYGFEGTYDTSVYNGSAATKQVVNDPINEFVEQDKHVAAVCYGVSVLAYARVDGASPLDDQDVTGWNGFAPSIDCHYRTSRAQIEANGASMFASGAIGDPTTSADDVYVEGKAFGDVIAQQLMARYDPKQTASVDQVFAEIAAEA